METRIGGEVHHFYGPGGPDFVLRESDLKKDGKRSLEWDLNDWKWDGDLFIASPLNSAPADGSSRQLLPVTEIPTTRVLSNSLSSCSDEINLGSERGKKEIEKRRRVVMVENEELNDGQGNLTLKLSGHVADIEIANWDEKNGKKTKLLGSTSNRAVCQVEDCGTDLSDARDYHRRHKVCEMHSKASQALVGNAMQRFCQQCSRFHLLQEFDEGKRSCRRRLAGHNRRRRKTHPDAVVNGSSLNDDPTSSYLLITLIKILSNIHANNSDRTKDQDLLSHLLKNLATLAGTIDVRNISGLLQESQDMLNVGTSARTSSEMGPALFSHGTESSRLLDLTSKNVDARGPQMNTIDQNGNVAASLVSQKGIIRDNALGGALQSLPLSKSTTLYPIEDNSPAKAIAPDSSVGRIKLNNIDLNSIYNDSQDYTEDLERSQSPATLGAGSLDCPSWLQKNSHQSSPPQTSGNSDSASAQSPSSSTGNAQSRTDRIVFKLFGKDPNDFPIVLRAQILDWLSHSPTDIESYIRPGCIILTIYLRLAESTWEELCSDLSSYLRRLLDVSADTFWTTGWAYVRVQHRIAFIYNGHVVLDTPLPLRSRNHCRISSITPIAVSLDERAQFIVKGFNLSQPTTKLLCALEGKYLLQEGTRDFVATNSSKDYDELQCLSFSCDVPDVTGRGFIEVEDNGLSGGFFPFIVAEQDVCSEIRLLENAIEVVESSDDDIQEPTIKTEAKNQALNFIHEMGWLLHRGHLRCRLDHVDLNSDVFPFIRFRWLMEFSMDRDWCAVVKKLLDILFDGIVGVGEFSSIELAVSEMGLLHRAVRRSCRQMVELLLGYIPKASATAGSKTEQQVKRGLDGFLFRPDAAGPAGLTPLHIVASRDGSENVLDALTSDPGLVGVEAWKNARDNTGFTPEDYARLRGHYSYIHLVHRKISKKPETGHVILDIPVVLSDSNSNQRQTNKSNSAKVASFEINQDESRPNQIQQPCKLCHQQLTYSNTRRSLVYRPVMLSMVAIAAVCVCVGLLFKSSPEVMYVFPFRWELLDYGAI